MTDAEVDEMLSLGVLRREGPIFQEVMEPAASEEGSQSSAEGELNDTAPLPRESTGSVTSTAPLPRESTGSVTSTALSQTMDKRSDKTYIGQMVEQNAKRMEQDAKADEKEEAYRERVGLFLDKAEWFMNMIAEVILDKQRREDRKIALKERELALLEQEMRLKCPRLDTSGEPSLGVGDS